MSVILRILRVFRTSTFIKNTFGRLLLIFQATKRRKFLKTKQSLCNTFRLAMYLQAKKLIRIVIKLYSSTFFNNMATNMLKFTNTKMSPICPNENPIFNNNIMQLGYYIIHVHHIKGKKIHQLQKSDSFSIVSGEFQTPVQQFGLPN